jgi:hypothetical protein
MSAILEFNWNSRDLDVWRGGKVEFALARAMRLAGNQAAREMRKATVEYIASRKFLRESYLMSPKRLKLMLPKSKTAIRDMEWVEHVSGKSIELSRYPHIQTPRGVSVRVNKGAGTTRIRSAFVRTNRRGHEAIFRRRGKRRLPIDELRSTRLVDVMSDTQAQQRVLSRASARFESAFARGLARETRKMRGSGDL